MAKMLSCKVALVTGGARGIGAAAALALAELGANVAISFSASVDRAASIVSTMQAKLVRAKAYKADQAVSVATVHLPRRIPPGFRGNWFPAGQAQGPAQD